MHKNILLAVGITIMFLGFAVQPGIATIQPENIDVEYVDVTTEFIGLGKECTTQLTTEEITELDALFDSIGDNLNKSVSREETIVIFKEAILELDRYGLLGDVGIDETEKLVTSYYQRTVLMKTLERLYNRKKGTLSEDENIFCLIVGKTTGVVFFKPMVFISITLSVALLMKYLMEHGDYYPGELELLMSAVLMMLIIPATLIPFCLGRTIGFEDWARGKIITFGLNGLKYWNGKLKGKLELVDVENIGVRRFTGLKIEIVTAPYQYFFGFATQVHIEDS